MSSYDLIIAAIAGIVLYLAIFSGMAAFRNRKFRLVHFLLTLNFINLFAYCFFDLYPAFHRNISVDLHLIARFQFAFFSLGSIAWLWFLYIFLKIRRTDSLLYPSILFILLIVTVFLLPSSSLYPEMIKDRTGEVMILPVNKFHWSRFLYDLGILILLASSIWMVISSGVRDRQTLFAILSGPIVLLLAGWNDHLIDHGMIDSVYLLPIGWLIMVLAISSLVFKRLVLEKRQVDKVTFDEQKWHALLDNVELIVVGLDRMGVVNYANPYLLHLTGYTEEELIGMDWFAILVPSRLTFDVQSAFIEILEHDFHRHYSNPIKTKSGQEIDVEWHNVKLQDKEDKLVGTISIGIVIGPSQAK